METIITPTKITKENFSEFGEVISAEKVNPIDINDGFAKRYDNLADINTLKDKGKTIVSIFSSVKRSFPMKIDMMEKHPLGSQAFMPMKETTFLCFVAPQGDLPKISKIKSFIEYTPYMIMVSKFGNLISTLGNRKPYLTLTLPKNYRSWEVP